MTTPAPPRPSDRRPLLGLRRKPGRLALALFRMPLHAYRHDAGGLLGHTFLQLTHVGRRTGQPHDAVAMVLRYDKATSEAVICAAWGPDTDWVRNLRAGPARRVQLIRESFTPEHRFLGDDKAFEIAVRFRRAHPDRLRLLSTILGWGDLRDDDTVRKFVHGHPFVAFRPAHRTQEPEVTTSEQKPLTVAAALRDLARCMATTAVLLARRRIHLPREHVGLRLRFADGTSARVYRETLVDRAPPGQPCVLVVEFRLRGVHRWGHVAFRAESLLNTPLFVGFPGYVSKLWLAHDEHEVYRGLYEWDSPALAESYARALWRVLALVCRRRSIRYQVLPGLRRDDLLRDPCVLDRMSLDDRHRDGAAPSWRLVAVG